MPVKRPSSGTSHLPEESASRGATAAPGPFQPQQVTPFRRTSPVVGPDNVDLSLFPLERYAEVVGALAAQEPRQAVLRRFVLNEEMWTALANAWALRLSGDPSLQKAFSGGHFAPSKNRYRQGLVACCNAGKPRNSG